MKVTLLVLSHGMQSGLAVGRNAFHCCHRFDVLLDKLLYVTPSFVYDFCISKVDISGHSSAVGRAQDSESSPVKDQRSTAAPRNQPISIQ